jgi:hypothetical protein
MNNNTANRLFGLPSYNQTSEAIKQGFVDSCAIKSQEIILNYMGIDVDEAILRDEAIDNGWYTPGMGTPVNHVGRLLESHGLSTHQQHHASTYNLISELSKGHPVIVGVDSGELWNPGASETFEDIIIGPKADHALIVGGIEFNDDFTSGAVSLIDPGTGEFGASYDIDHFIDAWEDSDNFMVTFD